MAQNDKWANWQAFGLSGADFLQGDWASQVARLRQTFVKTAQAIESDVPDMASVTDFVVDGTQARIPVRAYTPLAAGVAPGPAMVYFHGGGFVLGDVVSFDTICRRLADASRCRILSVGYRLSPEHKFPAPLIDAGDAYNWAVESARCLGRRSRAHCRWR